MKSLRECDRRLMELVEGCLVSLRRCQLILLQQPPAKTHVEGVRLGMHASRQACVSSCMQLGMDASCQACAFYVRVATVGFERSVSLRPVTGRYGSADFVIRQL